MNAQKEKNIKKLVKILVCLDGKDLLIIKSNAEVLKTRGQMDKQAR